jgi:hypothetical protein
MQKTAVSWVIYTMTQSEFMLGLTGIRNAITACKENVV